MKLDARTPRLRVPGVALLCTLWLATMRAQADDSVVSERVHDQEPAAYREAVEDGLREFEAQNFEEARSLFLRAHAISANARTYRALGLSEFELRNYVDCIGYLEAALASSAKPLNPTQRTESERVLSRANAFVGQIKIEVKPGPAHVSLDGTALEPRSGAPLLLAIGEHSLEVSASGFKPEKRVLKIKGGERRTLSFLLAPTSDSASAEPGTGDGSKHWYKSPWLWASMGVVVAGAAAGTGYVLLHKDKSASGSGGTSNVKLSGP